MPSTGQPRGSHPSGDHYWWRPSRVCDIHSHPCMAEEAQVRNTGIGPPSPVGLGNQHHEKKSGTGSLRPICNAWYLSARPNSWQGLHSRTHYRTIMRNAQKVTDLVAGENEDAYIGRYSAARNRCPPPPRCIPRPAIRTSPPHRQDTSHSGNRSGTDRNRPSSLPELAGPLPG